MNADAPIDDAFGHWFAGFCDGNDDDAAFWEEWWHAKGAAAFAAWLAKRELVEKER